MEFDPHNSKCINCGEPFEQPIRTQGGGSVKVYCSARCRSTDWARKNPIKRQVAIKKYDAKPPSREKKKERSLRAKLNKYGLDEMTFLDFLYEQGCMCRCCPTKLNKHTARIDHCHKTGKIRGLLCDHCNWALGHAKDSVEILTNLIEYLKDNKND